MIIRMRLRAGAAIPGRLSTHPLCPRSPGTGGPASSPQPSSRGARDFHPPLRRPKALLRTESRSRVTPDHPRSPEDRADIGRCVLVAIGPSEVSRVGLKRQEIAGGAFDRRVLPGEAELLDQYPELPEGLELVVVLLRTDRALAAWIAPRADLSLLAEHSSCLRQVPQSPDRISVAAKQVPPREERERSIAGRRQKGSWINPERSSSSHLSGTNHASRI